MTEGFSAEPTLDRPEAPDARDAQLAVARAALRRLSLIDEMAGMGQRDGDPELTARCRHAAGALVTMDRLAAEGPETPAPEPQLPEGEYARVEIMGHDCHTGWVTERDRAGVRVLAIADWEGRVLAEVPGQSLYRYVPLPTPLRRPEPQERAAITRANPDYDGDGWDSRSDYGDDGLGDDDDEEEPF